MKDFNLVSLNLSKVQRLFKLSIAFFEKQTMIFCIEAKDNDWKFTDMKNTVANDIIIKRKFLSWLILITPWAQKIFEIIKIVNLGLTNYWWSTFPSKITSL